MLVSLRIEEHPILKLEKGRKVKFTFEGSDIEGYEGEPIAAALVAAGVKVFRRSTRYHRPRGFFCATGKCASCLMEVEGKPNVMVCMAPVRQGLAVRRQHGKGDIVREEEERCGE